MGCGPSAQRKDTDLHELYDLEHQLGAGAEGEVWLATCKTTGSQVAIKLLKRGFDMDYATRVKREVQLQASMSHVNIVELRQVVLTRHHLAIVQTYEAGGDLQAFCGHTRMSEDVGRYIFRQVIAALEYCHAHRVAHRDLKLANFLLSKDKPPWVKLTDFGCARQWDATPAAAGKGGNQAATLDRFKTYTGTPAYMAPEVLECGFYSTPYGGQQADVWACGILITQMFFGQHVPYWMEPTALRDPNRTAQQRLQAMKKLPWAESDAWVREHAGELSADLRDLLSKIFIADEEQRITIEGIKRHPWFTAPLPPALTLSLMEQSGQQALRDSMQRTAVTRAAGHADFADADGSFATLDAMVHLAERTGRMPSPGLRVAAVDMAHLEAPAPVPVRADASHHRSTASLQHSDSFPESPFASVSHAPLDPSLRGLSATAIPEHAPTAAAPAPIHGPSPAVVAMAAAAAAAPPSRARVAVSDGRGGDASVNGGGSLDGAPQGGGGGGAAAAAGRRPTGSSVRLERHHSGLVVARWEYGASVHVGGRNAAADISYNARGGRSYHNGTAYVPATPSGGGAGGAPKAAAAPLVHAASVAGAASLGAGDATGGRSSLASGPSLDVNPFAGAMEHAAAASLWGESRPLAPPSDPSPL